MQFESQWPGDAVAAPFWGAYDQQDALIESLGERSWARVARRSDQADADPTAVVLQDWRGTAINLRPAGSAPRPQRGLQHSGINNETAPSDFAGWRAWIVSIASVVAKLWSRMIRERKSRRIRAAWEAVDDRTLKDIGISRYEIEYGRDPQHWG
jgi:uncharacterized protein YjiS (DUF1127 family)